MSAAKKRDQYIANYLSYDEPVTGHQVLEDFNIKINSDSNSNSQDDLDHERQRVIAWQVNNYTRSLDWLIDEDAMVEFIQTTSPAGLRIYQRSLDFLFIIACEIALDDPEGFASAFDRRGALLGI